MQAPVDPNEFTSPLARRAANVAHRMMASSLILLSAGGLAFIAYGCRDIYMRSKLRQQKKTDASGSQEA
jgi:hypothetical protein